MIEMRISHPPDGYALLGRICSCAIDLLRFFFLFYLVLVFHWVMAYCLPVWQEGLIFARHTRAHEHNVRPELMTLKMLKNSNRQTGFPFPIQANRLAIIVFTVSNSLGLNLESLVPTWVSRAHSGVCLARTTESVSLSPTDSQSRWRWLNLMPLQSRLYV